MKQVIPESWQVPPRFRQRMGAQAGRQRAMVDSGHLLLVLHEVPRPDGNERLAKLFWRAPEGTWKATGGGSGDGLPVLKRHLEAFQTALTALDTQVDKGQSAQDFFAVLNAATPLQRTTRNMHKALQEARDGVEDKDVITLRDQGGELERAAEILVSDARNGMEYSIARNAEAQAATGVRAVEAQHKLNLLAALFFPVTAIGSILGINLRTGLEGSSPLVFWAVLVAAFGVGFAVRSSLGRPSGDRPSPR